MSGRTSLLKASALALSLGLLATTAQAASVVDAAKQTDELSRFSEAITAAGLDQKLSGEGPFTIFAPTNEAFEQLPQAALDELMKQENRSQLTRLLQHHIVAGEKLAATEVLGKQTEVDTVSGDTLTVDATSQVVLLVPTGLMITRVGDQVIVEREGMAVPAGAVEVQDEQVRKAGDEGQQAAAGVEQKGQEQQTAARTTTAEPSDMPVSEHQQEVLKSEPGQEQQQTAAEGATDMPATEHQQEVLTEGGQQGQQEQTAARTATAEPSDMLVTEHQQEVLRDEPAKEQQQTAAEGGTEMPATQHQKEVIAEGGQQGQHEEQTAARTTTAERSDMPMSEHQQEVLRSEPGQEQQQTGAGGGTDMPSTEHQREALAEDELPGEQEQSYEHARVLGAPDILREATVVEPDIQADNGVIHVIDAVLVPQSVLETLQSAKGQS
jgi:uncharacterized surface protein with fasciclin (FAS1) repeats